MTGFRPWIRKQQEDPVETIRGQPVDEISRIIRIDSDVAEPFLINLAKQARHAIDEGLATDIAAIGMCDRLRSQMFAAAESYFQATFFWRVLK